MPPSGPCPPGPDRDRFGVGQNDQLHIFTDQTLQHIAQANDDRVDIEQRRTLHVAAAECEQLPGKRGGPLGGLQNFHRVGPGATALG